jgi:hypothetical protein
MRALFLTLILSAPWAVILPAPWAFILPASSAEAAQSDRTADFFPVGKTTGTPLFVQSYHFDESPDGVIKSISDIKDETGKVLMTEVATFKGDRILSQNIEQLQIDEAYELVVKEQTVTFKTFKIKGGKHVSNGEDKTEKYTDAFVTGPVWQAYIQKHWDKIMAGKKVPMDFGIFELEKSVAFNLYKQSDSGETKKIRMKIANSIYSFFVDPIDMEFDKNKILIRYIGRTPLRTMVNGKLKPFDGEILYHDKGDWLPLVIPTGASPLNNPVTNTRFGQNMLRLGGILL